MIGRARRRAARQLDHNLDALAGTGYRATSRTSDLEATLRNDVGPPLRARMVANGRVFGGVLAFELSTAEPVLPATAGITVRGRGVVAQRGVRLRPRRGDEAARALAARLERDEDVTALLGGVHFEQAAITGDGRVAIRHMGGSLVWLLFPPMTYPVRLTAAQAGQTVAALAALARAGPTDDRERT